MPSGTRAAVPRAEMRERLLQAAADALEAGGPEAVQVRSLAAQVGASTQAVYTLFGGLPGLFEALIAVGFGQLRDRTSAVPETDDPVADHFAKGGAYVDWALTHPQLYRLMFGLTGGALRLQRGLEMTVSGTLANFPEGQAAMNVMIRSIDRVKASGRIRDGETIVLAGQILSATHGFILLTIAGAFGDTELAFRLLPDLGVTLLVGLGDDRGATVRSMELAVARGDYRQRR
jgi:AcrR family transcriptional regulator